jgi:hypothetical protein
MKERTMAQQQRNVTTDAEQDWRLQGQDWLREELLRYQAYAPAKAGSEHDHCEFCWTPFRSRAQSGAASEGYVTQDRRWICETCYEDFKLMFDWIVEM